MEYVVDGASRGEGVRATKLSLKTTRNLLFAKLIHKIRLF